MVEFPLSCTFINSLIWTIDVAIQMIFKGVDMLVIREDDVKMNAII